MLLSCNLSSTFIVWDHADLILVSKIITLSSSSDGNEILIAMLKGFHVVVSSVKIESSTSAQPALLHKFSTQITGTLFIAFLFNWMKIIQKDLSEQLNIAVYECGPRTGGTRMLRNRSRKENNWLKMLRFIRQKDEQWKRFGLGDSSKWAHDKKK